MMTRIATSGIFPGIIEHQKIYERDTDGNYTVLISHKVRYFWKWVVVKFPKEGN